MWAEINISRDYHLFLCQLINRRSHGYLFALACCLHVQKLDNEAAFVCFKLPSGLQLGIFYVTIDSFWEV